MKITNTYLKGITTAAAISTALIAIPAFAQVQKDSNQPQNRPSIHTTQYRGEATSTRPIPTNAAMGSKFASTSQEMKLEREANKDNRQASNTQARIDRGAQMGANMIDQRIQSLTKLLSRIQSMKHITDADKTLLENSINTEIADLNTLKATISTDTSTTSMKSDVSSITKSYRIYALVEPQAQIIAAADRVLAIVDSLNTIADKVNTRLASSTSASSTVNTTSTMSDFVSKLADATSKAHSAIDAIASLKPDNGDTTVAASNKSSLQAARQDVVAAQKDLKDAEQDLRTVVGVISHNAKSIGNVNGVGRIPPSYSTSTISTSSTSTDTTSTTTSTSTDTTATSTDTTSTSTATTTP